MSRNARLAVSGAALTALLAVVAVASHAHRPGGGTSAATSHAPALLFDYVASAMLVLFPLGVIVVIWAMAQGRHQRLLAGETNWRRTVAGLAIMFALIGVAVYINRHRHDFGIHFGGSGQAQKHSKAATTPHRRQKPP